MLNAARGYPAQSKTPLIPAHRASLRAFTPVFDGLWTPQMRLCWKSRAEGPGPATAIPREGRAIESLLRHSRQTAAPRFMQRRACAQVEVRLFYAFFRGSAAGLRLRVSGVTSTSVACVMNPASDVPRGLS